VPSGVARFAEFELDSGRYELRRGDRVLKLEKIPMEILTLLVESSGQLVTRDQIIDRIWGKDVFLDTEHGINTAIRKIRQALGDDPEQPRFVQTITGKGYRFIAPAVEISPGGIGSAIVEARPPVETPSQIHSTPDSTRQLPQSPRRLRSSTLALVTGLALVSAYAVYFGWRRINFVSSANAGHVMLAVLPFENLSGNPNEDYFSDGLTEELITQLGALSPDQLGVIARTSSMAYKRTSKSVQQIAGELGVDYIIESSVRLDGDQMRISVQLIRTRDQVHLWVHSYDRQVSHSIALQEDVAKAVAEQIEIKLRPAYSGPANQRPLDPQANEAYLRGRYFENQFTVAGFEKAISYFQQAIDRDPNLAEAYSGLSDSYHFLVVTDAMSTQDGESKALDAAQQAVARGGGMAESHNALGGVMIGLYNWSQAETELKRAIELNPSYSTEHRIYAALLVTLKRHEEAWEQISQAMRTDPLSLPNNAEVIRTLYYARDYDRAIEQANKAFQLDPNYYRNHFWLARVYAQKGMQVEAIAESEKVLAAMPDSSVGLTEYAYSLAVAGRQPEARKILQRLQEKSKHEFVPAYNFAIIHVALGESDKALDYLQKAYQERDWALMVLAVEPRLDPLRSDLRFRELLGKVRLHP
jgi:TolB-like protein/DNA-binding winged helix-turn-helix (wHTH) protein/Flp pilus assembly protein TadD